jgi:UDP:flavonoid glycosyltransferase YjiC (YdhE family)
VRLLFTAYPGYGHVHPMLPLARAAQRAGHEVQFATGPDLVERVRGYGFAATAVGLSSDDIVGTYNERYDDTDDLPPQERLPKVVPRMFVDIGARASLPDVLALVERWRPDFIVSEQSESAGPIVAHATGIPNAVHGWGPIPPRQLIEIVVPAIQSLAREFFDVEAPEPGALPYVDICPPGLQLSPDLFWNDIRPLRHEDPPGDELPAGLPDANIVYVTLGTVVNKTEGAFETVLEALRGVRDPIVVTVGPDVDPARLGAQRDNVVVEQFIPQGALLPRCRAVIAHAGAGTTLGALAAGLPMVLLPHGAEQFLNAAACAAAGVAEVVMPEQLSAEAVRAAFERMGETHTASARRLAAEIAAMPTADDTLETLLS